MLQVGQLEQSIAVVFDDMFEGIQILDAQLRYVYLNKAAEKHGRQPARDLLGRKITEAYPGIENTPLFAIMQTCLRERSPRHLVNHFTYPGGESAWFDLRINPVPMGLLVLSIDISDQKAAEQELTESRENLAITLESMADAVITTDTEQRVARMNPAAEMLTGWREEAARGKALDELVTFLNQRTGEKVEHPVQEVMRHGSKIGLANDTVLVARDGSRIPIASSGAPLRDAGGAIRGVVIVLKNVKEEYELAAMLHQSQKMEAIGRLAGGIAHDFNNLLTVIVGYCDLLLQRQTGDATMAADVEEIRRAGEQAQQLTRQLLAFSRKEEIRPEYLDLNDVVSRMNNMLRRVIGERIQFVTCLQPGMPAIFFDAGHMSQVIMNLVVNAREAMPDGGVLTIETAASGDRVKLVVRDTGVGMSAETQAKIFEPFYTTKTDGTGLGLATTYGLLQQEGGSIAVESEPGRGTTFTVTLPTT